MVEDDTMDGTMMNGMMPDANAAMGHELHGDELADDWTERGAIKLGRSSVLATPSPPLSRAQPWQEDRRKSARKSERNSLVTPLRRAAGTSRQASESASSASASVKPLKPAASVPSAPSAPSNAKPSRLSTSSYATPNRAAATANTTPRTAATPSSRPATYTTSAGAGGGGNVGGVAGRQAAKRKGATPRLSAHASQRGGRAGTDQQVGAAAVGSISTWL